LISASLIDKLACPVCLEAAGCSACARPGAGHSGCAEYAARVRCPCGGPDKPALLVGEAEARCQCCGAAYPLFRNAGYIDLVPRTAVGERTRYADHDFHERLGVSDAPPLLSARIKADMMRRMLRPAPGAGLIDLGCGAGKLALYAAEKGSRTAGLDVAPFFLPRAVRSVDLALGDLRRLPFRKAAFEGAFSLDVLEHLDEADLGDVLLETRRLLAPGGGFFVYTHALEPGVLAPLQRALKRLAARLGRIGLLDYEREALRKSDHKNAILSHDHFDRLCGAAGLRVTARRYYNVLFKAVIEDILFRIYEQGARVLRRGAPVAEHPEHEAGTSGHEPAFAPPPGRVAVGIGRALTWLLELDVRLLSGIRNGPFFAVLRPLPAADIRPAGRS
jgi:SAM-dependent methyltransferase